MLSLQFTPTPSPRDFSFMSSCTVYIYLPVNITSNEFSSRDVYRNSTLSMTCGEYLQSECCKTQVCLH